jgi:outer membrane protein with beta-barrel domain
MGLFTKLSPALFVFSAACFAQIPGPIPLSVGAKVGIPITDSFYNTQLGPNVNSYSNSQNYIIGPTVELRLPYHLSVEFDALYRPLTFGTSTASVVNGAPVITRTSTDLSTWEFPLMFKYHFGEHHFMRPYVEVGPSFRTTSKQLSYLSSNGVTAGVGADFKALFLRLSPEVRYTHWGDDGRFTPQTAPLASRQDQVEFLFGLSF